MNWLIMTFRTSIGKKLMMAVTGLCFLGFLSIHLAGNLTLYWGKARFNAYAESLHSLGPLVTAAEWILLILGLVHVLTGAILFYQNLRARPVSYRVKKRAGGRTLGSATMPYTGLMILGFVLFHLINFHFTDRTDRTIYQIVHSAFHNPWYVGIYVAAMIVVAVHISHGFWSLFQTLGANHPRYMPFVERVGIGVSLIFGAGFGLIPLYLASVP